MSHQIVEIEKFSVRGGDIERAPEADARPDEGSNYLDVIMLAERLHRQFLDVIQAELDGLGVRDINSVRALILLNIGDAEMTASELLWRGCYLGSNVSYNLKKLTEAGYVNQVRSMNDRRVVMIRNSSKGMELYEMLMTMNARHLDGMSRANFKLEDLDSCRKTLRTLQQFWSRTIRPARPAQQSHAA